MFSRFFIDRLIFATVISVAITFAGFVAVWTLPVAQYPEVTPPTVQVTALYPGANAYVVRDTVAAPIEAQVNGVEGMIYMSSRCTNDGTYTLTVTFKMGMDSDMAQVLVQNRVALALPVIPQLVQSEGILVRKMSPNTLMIVNLISPDNSFDSIYLSNYATIFVKDELNRVDGVADISYFGQRDYALRAWLDPDKMAALNLDASDVVSAIASQNVQVAAGQIGQPPTIRAQQFQLTINTQGRLTETDQFANIIVKAAQDTIAPAISGGAAPATGGAAARTTGASGQSTGIVRLRDVVRNNRYFYRIRLDPAKLAQRNLTAQDALKALQPRPTSITPETAGDKEPPPTWLAKYSGFQAPSVERLAATRIVLGGGRRGQQLELGDLVAAHNGIEHLEDRDEEGVQLGSQQYDQTCTLDGKPSVALSIFQLPGSNALATAKGIYAKMRELKTRFPKGLDYEIVYDTTPFITESVDEVWHTLRDAVILVAIVVLLFLQDWRAMILPMIDVPVSLIGTFAVMAMLGFTLNNLTLFGLVLAIGIVVDDAIVVLENIERLMATGLDARTATIQAMAEITGPILAITLVLTAVFVPCCFLGGITGQFFRQFAVTIAVSTIISAINAITMTPSRAVLIFQIEEEEDRRRTENGGRRTEESAPSSVLRPPSSALPKREALPWWLFAIIGGLVTFWFGPKILTTVFHLPEVWRPLWNGREWLFEIVPWHTHGPKEADIPAWASWTAATVYFLPGAGLGAGLGLLLIRWVNAVLGIFFGGFNRVFDRMTVGYGSVVGKVLRLSAIVCVLYVGLLALTAWQFVRAPSGFIPQQDKGYLILNVQLLDAASVDRTEKQLANIQKIIDGDPQDLKNYPGIKGIDHTVSISGKSIILNANAPNLGSMYVMLSPFEERHDPSMSADAIAKKLRDACKEHVKGAIVTTFGGPPVDGLGTTGGFKIIIEDRGNLGPDELQRVGEAIAQRGNDTPGLTGLVNSSRTSTPWVYLDIDRTKAKSLGVEVGNVFNTLQIYNGSYFVNNFNKYGRTWQVIVQADQRYRGKVADLGNLQERNSDGQMVRLRTLLDWRDISGPVMVMRYNTYSATAITGDTTRDVSSGQAIDLMQKIADKTMPASMGYDWTELTYLQLQAGNKPTFVFFLAVIFVFLVLAAQYESWSLPLAVILVVPMCLLCSVTGMILAKMEVNLFTQIGFVVLVGLASKNAILIVEFAKQRREAGVPGWEATVEAAKLRLRPIIMTSFAFILGVVPLAIAKGAGAEMRRSLGLAVFAGMLGVTMFGIFLTPVFFYVIQRFLATKPTVPPAPPAGPASEAIRAARHD